jgi:hypothetical protein
MHFSNAALLSILTLTTSTMAAPQAALEPALAPETLVARSEVSETEIVWLGLQERSSWRYRQGALEKRLAPVAIALISVIGGKLFAGAATAGVEVAKSYFERPDLDDFKDFGEVGWWLQWFNKTDVMLTRGRL